MRKDTGGLSLPPSLFPCILSPSPTYLPPTNTLRGKAVGAPSKPIAVYKLRKELSSETKSPATLFLDSPVLRAVRNKFLLFKLASLWYFVTAAQAD